MQSNISTSIENTPFKECSTLEELHLAVNGMTDDVISLSNSTIGLCGILIPNLSTLYYSKNLLNETKFLTTSATSSEQEENYNFPLLEESCASCNNITSFDSISNL